MITTSGGRFVLEEDSQHQFSLSNIICGPHYYELTEVFDVDLIIQDSVSTNHIITANMRITKAEVDAETGSGTGEVAPWFDALQKAVKTKLAAIPDNSGITFTIV
jgi:hypothetical protein